LNTIDTVNYYPNLLIMQYRSKDKAYATMRAWAAAGLMLQVSTQVITFSLTPTSGSVVFSYADEAIASLGFAATAGNFQTALRAIDGLEDVTVTGSFADGFTVIFVGVPAPADLIEVVSTTLTAAGPTVVSILIEETDKTLPLAVQDGYNLSGSNLATGAQLDKIAKYAGVTRSGLGFDAPITLNDTDFLQLIRMSIVKNNSGSSLGDIQTLLSTFFPGQVTIFDTQSMEIYYFISSDVGSQELIQMFVTQGLLPKPMGVSLSVILYVPDIENFFGFRTYASANPSVKPFNSYTNFDADWNFLSYHDVLSIPT